MIRLIESIDEVQKLRPCSNCLTSLLGRITHVKCNVDDRSPENAPAQTIDRVVLTDVSVGTGPLVR